MAMEKNFDAASAEARIYKAWESSGAFAAGANAKEGAETFSIMIPPPNVTGALHIGHAFNNTLQDVLTRWHRMRGHDTLWQPGQDHAGIATQLQVEKMLAEQGLPSRADMGREAFIEKVWEWKEKYGSTIINQLKRLGASCDWDRNAFTMDENFHDAVLKVFVDLYNKGLIYRGKRLVNWDPHFETAISDLEVENIEVDGHMWHFKYPLAGGATYTYVEKDEDGNIVLEEERDYISIATTRPETMLGDGAVAVHPDDERYAPIVGKLCEIPVGPKEHRRLIPIITDEYPDMTFGSGAVKITGAHDENDYGVAKRNNIPMYRLMDTRAHMRSDGADYKTAATRAKEISEGAEWDEAEIDALNLVPDAYRGMDRFEARKAVIKDIDAEGLMIMVEDKKIMQPFCDRSKVVMEPMLTDQWYVDAAKLAGPAREAVSDGRVKIIPESGEKVYFHWMNNIEPWCISRQLWWGHQIPVWYGPSLEKGKTILSDGYDAFSSLGKKQFCASSEQEVLNKAKDYYGTEIEITIEKTDPTALFGSGYQAEAIPNILGSAWGDNDPEPTTIKLSRDPDVLDTWFSSGLWPIGTLGWPEDTPELQKYFPTSTLITGQDILFFWVARMMMMQLEVTGQVPFHTVYLHQLVRDEKGVKMSKTLGNVIDPLDMIDEFGADAVRFTMTSMASIGGTLKLSTERVKGYRNFGTKLWSATRFAEMNECVPQPGFDPKSCTQTLNKWITGETARALDHLNASLDAYRFNDAASGLYAFVWGKVCDWYVELSKPIFFGEDQAAIAETRATMAWVIDQCLIMLHPIMPFITEELWGSITDRPKMLVHADWPTYTAAEMVDAVADHEMNWAISLIESIRSVRTEMHVPAGAKIPMLVQELDDAGRTAWANNQALIKRLARIESLTDAPELPKGAVTIAVEGGVFALPLADIIDISAEKERLEKTLGKLEKDMGGLKGRLNNPKFVASAPEDVVAESRELLAQKEEEASKLKAAMQRLTDMG
ncbi:valine--tRNA ligase [Profundibacter sp.]|uniref:valine--tRNA ligase n=1 Tax=Profundibacter sp. TaxID=3101071 RepID=UPI003D14F378